MHIIDFIVFLLFTIGIVVFGIPSVEEFCKTCIKNFYYFGDFFVKWRFTRGKVIGMGKPVAALEAMDMDVIKTGRL